MQYSAFVFDLDGTLLDTLEDLAGALNLVLKRHGLPPHPVDAFRTFVGNGASTLVARALPADLRGADRVAFFLDEFLREYARNWKEKTVLYPGVPQLLNALTRRGLKLAILTNKPQDLADQCVEEFLARWPFEVVMGQRPGYPVKPDPAVSHDITARINVPGKETVFVGDSDVDMLTGVHGGMFPVGVLWGFRTERELRAAGAEATVSRPEELLRLLE